jgi:hypothetical protein
MLYRPPAPLAWPALAGPLAAADDAVSRLDERLRASPIRAGWIARTHFLDACASAWIDGALVHLEDLVLHDAGRDIRAPTHELIRGHAVLRARRRILGEAPNWALSLSGLAALIGRAASRPGEGQGRIEADDEGAAAPDVDWPGPDEAVGDDPLRREYAELDAIEARSGRLLSQLAAAPASRDPIVYDLDWDEDGRLASWRAAVEETQDLPPLLGAAIALTAWEEIEPLQHKAWLGRLLVGALLRARSRTPAHLLCLNVGLRAVARERRRAHDATTRLVAVLEAFAQAAGLGMKEHDRWGLARLQLDQRLVGRRSNSHLPALVDLVIALPIVSAGMIAKELKVTARAAQDLVGELDLREMTGRGRYRAWGIL